ncbi:MAG TPA: glycosyltransferase [Thermoanaerobaculia bacterium]|nr:glycosyltransferase [Thermoanaerobaculia bacterium]
MELVEREPRDDFSGLRVAVIHDWLTGMRGGERVLEAIVDLFPSAEIFTLFHFEGSVSSAIESHRIHVSPLQPAASRVRNYRLLLPFYPAALAAWDFSRFDLLVSSSHCVAKGAAATGVPHVSYCHTPMRYVWDRFDDYFPPRKPLLRLAGSTLAPALRRWDVATAAGVDRFIANSSFVSDRIRRFYQREADVVHPFVDPAFFRVPVQEERGDFHLLVSALVPYKKVELAIEAAALEGFRLVIAGGGPLLETLRKDAPENVRLTGKVTEEELIGLMGEARSLLIPGVEDFGIVALEAMALGTPVIARALGGVADSVIGGETGILMEQEGAEAIVDAVREVEARDWNRSSLRSRAMEFSRTRFQEGIAGVIRQVLRKP